MRIGVYIGSSHPETGGAYTFQKDIIDSLNAFSDGYEYFVFTSHSRSFPPTQDYEVISTRLQFWSKIYYKFYSSLYKFMTLINRKGIHKTNLMRLCREKKIDLIWFMSSTFEDPGVPYIFTVWDLAHKYFPYLPEIDQDGSGLERREIFYKKSLSKAAIILTGTDIGKHDIINFYTIPQERVRIVPFPTPRYILGGNLRETINPFTNHSRDFIFYPAQFWSHKNHIIILLALKILKEKYGKILDVVFTGSDQGNLDFIKEQTKKSGLEGQVHLLGFVSQQQLTALYKQAKMLVFPTYFGPDNLPPLEAFALSCPVVASNIPGAKEQLGDAALLFNPADENELAECILSVLENEETRKQLVEKGLKRSITWTSSDYKNLVLSHIDQLKYTIRLWKNV